MATLLRLLDECNDRPVFLLRRAIDLVVLVLTDHVHVGRHLDHVEAVNVQELLGLGDGGAGHAGELPVEPEIVLEGDGGERLVLGLDAHMLLGLERLMQSFGIAPALHHAPGELVDDDHLVVLDDVVAVALEQGVGAQRLLHVVDDGDVLDVVERVALEHVGLGQQPFDLLVAGLGQGDDAGLLVEVVVALRELGNESVDLVVELGAVVERSRDDERRARLVDQDRVHLVDDGEVVAALHHLRGRVFHVVAEIVEAELVVGAVGHVAGILLAALLIVQIVQDAADGEAQEFVDGAHPGRVALGEIVVDGDDMHALARERIEIDGKGGNQRLAFAGLHLGDAPLVQHHAADQLHVEMALANGALGAFAYGGEGLGDQIIELGAVLQALAESFGARPQVVVGERHDLGLERIDLGDDRSVFLEFPLVG